MNTNSSSLNNAITHAFEQIEVALNQKLKQQGYKIFRPELDDHTSKSNSIIWTNNIKALRLKWDAIESHFILEVSDVVPISLSNVWIEIMFAPYDPHKYDEHYVVTIAGEFVDRVKPI